MNAMTIKSQLDQVLALFDLPDTPLNGVLVAEHCYAFMKEHGPAIRAAVGGVGETVAWWREDHVCHAHELTTADALADGYKPCVIKCEDCAWNASLCDTHGAVGGEAVVIAHRLHTPGGKWQWMNGMPSKQALDDSKNFGWKIEYAYASPTATVDVGVLSELVEKWRGSARGGSQYSTTEYEDGCTAELRRCADELAALIGKEA